MLTLTLLRHAKSAWDDPGLDDFERGLAPRGIKTAPEVGKYLKRHKLVPSLVICSGAVRTRATLALILPELGAPAPEIRFDDALYLAHTAALADVVRNIADGPQNVLLIGHNPGIHALALELSGGGNRKALAELATKFPTAALAVLTFEATHLHDIRAGSGRLEEFVTPRKIGDR